MTLAALIYLYLWLVCRVGTWLGRMSEEYPEPQVKE